MGSRGAGFQRMPWSLPTQTVDLGPAAAAIPAGPLDGTILLHIEAQCRADWCWAAVCVSIARHYGHVRSQSEFAYAIETAAGFPVTPKQCAIPPCDATTTTGSYPSTFLPLTGLAPSPREDDRALTEVELLAEVSAARPVGIQIRWDAAKGGKAHFIAVVGGINTASGVQYLVGDPMDANIAPLRYAGLLRYRGIGTWVQSSRMGP
jgi:Papain-like cysteine protease AvrRpt2